MIRLLLDENISPALVGALLAEGIDAAHVRDRALLGATDAEVLERAFVEDRVLVTKNVDDFVALARAREIHAGILLLEDGFLLRDEQLQAIRQSYAFMEQQPDMVNRALSVAIDGAIRIEEMPPA